jgi:N-glycosylase/DNA lyase
MKPRTVSDRRALQEAFAMRGAAIRNRLADFAAVAPDDYFYELVYCLLTPQSSAVNAGTVVDRLREADLLHREIALESVLRDPSHYIRFHNTKARWLREARADIAAIVGTIIDTHDSAALRVWLIRHVNGLGWKEASHFLRNIGRRNLAILDRHILKNLVRYGVLRSRPKTLTPKRYLAIERRFMGFADEMQISMDELDLLFWSLETGLILK